MFNRIAALFFDRKGAAASTDGVHDHDEVQLAAAALLVEAAWQDDSFDEADRVRVTRILRRRFGLEEEEAGTLIDTAEATVRRSAQILPFTRVIKDRFSHEERIEMVEMLWEVVYADGVLHDHQATLMRRIGGLIYVSDQERGAARKRALARIKSAPDEV